MPEPKMHATTHDDRNLCGLRGPLRTAEAADVTCYKCRDLTRPGWRHPAPTPHLEEVPA